MKQTVVAENRCTWISKNCESSASWREYQENRRYCWSNLRHLFTDLRWFDYLRYQTCSLWGNIDRCSFSGHRSHVRKERSSWYKVWLVKRLVRRISSNKICSVSILQHAHRSGALLQYDYCMTTIWLLSPEGWTDTENQASRKTECSCATLRREQYKQLWYVNPTMDRPQLFRSLDYQPRCVWRRLFFV